MSEALCRGSWLLGSACGHCSRCIEEAPKAFKIVMEERNHLQKKFLAIVGCIPRDLGPYSDRVKLNLFAAAHEVVYAKETPIETSARSRTEG